MEESGSGDKFYASILATNEDERRTLVAKMLTYVRHHLKQPERAYVRKVVELAKSRFDTASHYEKPADFLKEGLLKDVVANPHYNTFENVHMLAVKLGVERLDLLNVNPEYQDSSSSTPTATATGDSYTYNSASVSASAPEYSIQSFADASVGMDGGKGGSKSFHVESALTYKVSARIDDVIKSIQSIHLSLQKTKCIYAGYTPEWGEYSKDWGWYSLYDGKKDTTYDDALVEPGSSKFATGKMTSSSMNDPFYPIHREGMKWAHKNFSPYPKSLLFPKTYAEIAYAAGSGNCPVHMTAGSTCVPTCKKGTTAKGKRACDNDGKLTDTFECQPDGCKRDASTPEHGDVNGGGNCGGDKLLAHGTYCKPLCESKEDVSGPFSVTVGYHGVGARYCFLGEIKDRFHCAPNRCDMISLQPENVVGDGSCLNDGDHGTTCKLQCDEGYDGKGERT